ncbi:hypothetical protein [Nitrosomonas sp. ANs5]|uniref:hypothetical protein n=1 Tax=Nitrosomonas sp. ANs5 TaxID=3423941 RepID=UPI003D346742
MKILTLLAFCLYSLPAFPVDVAPRISDREIIESLAELKAGQRSLQEKMDQRFTATQEQMDLRFNTMQEQMELRFNTMQEQMDLRFAAMQEQIDQRFAAVDQRFVSIDQRFEFLQQLMLVMIAAIFGLIGFIVWDRYTTLRPMDQRLRRIEEDLENDLELKAPDGSRIIRLIHALRELAKEDKKLEAVLRSFSLL